MTHESPRSASNASSSDFCISRATVTGAAGAWFFIEGGAGPDRALRAESCLLAPEVGDLVLVNTHSSTINSDALHSASLLDSAPFILAVLSRPQSASGVLTLPGGSRLVASEGGSLQVVAKAIQLDASASLGLVSPELTVRAARAELVFSHLSTVAQAVQARLGSLHCIAQNATSIVGRLVVRAVNSFRQTEQLDDSRAGRVRMQVAERFALSADHASIQAKGHVKIDGEKIDLG
jgi:Protein of unknown function (DUF3540)